MESNSQVIEAVFVASRPTEHDDDDDDDDDDDGQQ